MPTPTMTSEDLHQYNCYLYLKAASPEIELYTAPQTFTTFNQDVDYAALYHGVLEQIEQRYIQDPDAVEPALICKLYRNDNGILPLTYTAIRDTVRAQVPGGKSLEQRISQQWSNGKRFNAVITPYEAGSKKGRLAAMLSDQYKPQFDTSLTTKRTYPWQQRTSGDAERPEEYRMPTQAQRVPGETGTVVRMSPLFEAFLNDPQFIPPPSGSPITYVYFNHLRRDPRPTTMAERLFKECQKESAMTAALEALESKYSHIAVMTLPADDGIMHHRAYQQIQSVLYHKTPFQFLTEIAEENPDCKIKIRDFHISPRVRKLLFGETPQEQKQTIQALLTRAFDELGFKPDLHTLSRATIQAIWFHFINSLLPSHVITRLQPVGFNFSCKDGIDRGGVASAWYNLINSFNTAHPLSRDEFEQALHAAPAMVKGRGMNHHHQRIWNVINHYVAQDYAKLAADPKKDWLIHWRNMNCPKEVLPHVLTQTLHAARRHLGQLPQGTLTFAVSNLLAILQDEQKTEVHPWMLEVASRVSYLVAHPDDEEEKTAFNTLITQVDSSSAKHFIRGLMQIILGILTVSGDRLERGSTLIAQGYHGFFAYRDGQATKNVREALQQSPQIPLR